MARPRSTNGRPALPAYEALVERWERSASDRDRAQTRERLEAIPEGDAVCHALFHPGHVLLGECGPVVIDWPDAFAGPPALDVARTAVFLRFLGISRSAPEAAKERERRTRARVAEKYRAEYVAHTAVTPEEIDRCVPLVALTLLRSDPGNEERRALDRLAAV